jgi:hypothetical protein
VLLRRREVAVKGKFKELAGHARTPMRSTGRDAV